MRFIALMFWLASIATLPAATPPLLNHQGRIAVDNVAFDGTGQFKFALVDGDGSETFWSNDGSSSSGSEPNAAVNLEVAKGLYSVLLGDVSLANMQPVTESVFLNDDVRLRVWFSDGIHGFQHLAPDQRLAAAPYALSATSVDEVLLSDVIAPALDPVFAWGRNRDGQTTVPELSKVAAVAAGSDHSIALLKAGTLVQWGSVAAIPSGLEGVTHLAAGTAHNLVRKSDGSLVAWGDNSFGQTNTPMTTDAVEVAAGEKHSLALLSDGSVLAWGDDTFAQTSVPLFASPATAIAAGYDHSLALLSNGTVSAWGRNDAGVGQCDVPVGLSGVVAIAAGAYHSLAVKADGTVVAWGLDAGGQATVPFDLTDVKSVAAGYSFSVALKSDGTVVAWGDNADGQLNPPGGVDQVKAIAAGASHVLALQNDFIPAEVARLDQANVFTEKVGIRRVAATNTLEVEGTASKSTAGSWLSNSDRRIKTQVQTITGALDVLDRVRLVDFRYTPDYLDAHPAVADVRYLNVIAQEFAKVFPDHVKSSGETLPDGDEILQVDTYPLTIYSAAAVQELHRENQKLRRRVAAQEERLRRIEAAMGK